MKNQSFLRIKLILIALLTINALIAAGQGTIIDNGVPTNKWIFHNPEDNRKTLFIAPLYNGVWDFNQQTQFKPNGDVNFSGNIAIGTASNTPASSRLEVYGDFRTTSGNFSSIYSGNTAGSYPTNVINAIGSAQLSFGANWTNGYGDLALINSNLAHAVGGAGFGFYQMKNNTSSAALAYFRGDGNIGFGTTTPASRMHIVGGGMTLGSNALSVNRDGYLSLGDVNTDATPVSQNWVANSSLLLNALDYTTIGFHDAGNRVDFIRSGRGTIQLGYDGGWGAANIGLPGGVWNASGKVGVGTTTPETSLHLQSASPLLLTGAGNGLKIRDWNPNAVPNTDDWQLYAHDNLMSIHKVNVGDVLNIATSGNVGIGTTPPATYRLAVEGKIGAREVEVKASGWADFVFDSTYQLPSLESVEQHIATNKHLFGIPSEAEVKRDGYALGAMDAKLLQKIEELTLYIINQQKRIERLEYQVNASDKKR